MWCWCCSVLIVDGVAVVVAAVYVSVVVVTVVFKVVVDCVSEGCCYVLVSL